MSRLTHINETGAISTQQNARKSIKSSTIIRTTNCISHVPHNLTTTPTSVQTVGPSTSKPVVENPIYKCHQPNALSPPHHKAGEVVKSSQITAPGVTPQLTGQNAASERAHSARKRRKVTANPLPPPPKRKNRRSRYLGKFK